MSVEVPYDRCGRCSVANRPEAPPLPRAPTSSTAMARFLPRGRLVAMGTSSSDPGQTGSTPSRLTESITSGLPASTPTGRHVSTVTSQASCREKHKRPDRYQVDAHQLRGTTCAELFVFNYPSTLKVKSHSGRWHIKTTNES